MHRWWRRAAPALLFAAALGAHAAGAAQPLAVQLSPALGITTLADASAQLARPFDDPLAGWKGQGATRERVELRHCADWLQQRDQIVGADTEAEWRRLRHLVVDCDALALLSSARAATQSALPAKLSGLTDTRRWPVTLWVVMSPEDEVRAARPGVTLRTFSGAARWMPSRDGSLTLARGAWRVRLVELGRADVDGDGWDDWLLRWEARAVEGSWSDARLVVLTRRAGSGQLRELAARR